MSIYENFLKDKTKMVNNFKIVEMEDCITFLNVETGNKYCLSQEEFMIEKCKNFDFSKDLEYIFKNYKNFNKISELRFYNCDLDVLDLGNPIFNIIPNIKKFDTLILSYSRINNYIISKNIKNIYVFDMLNHYKNNIDKFFSIFKYKDIYIDNEYFTLSMIEKMQKIRCNIHFEYCKFEIKEEEFNSKGYIDSKPFIDFENFKTVEEEKLYYENNKNNETLKKYLINCVEICFCEFVRIKE